MALVAVFRKDRSNAFGERNRLMFRQICVWLFSDWNRSNDARNQQGTQRYGYLGKSIHNMQHVPF
jgi:hypothetical protein